MKKDWFPTKDSAQHTLHAGVTTALPAIAVAVELDPDFTAATLAAA